jgi:hypothetical protein
MGISSYARVAASLLAVSSVIAQSTYSTTITVDNETVGKHLNACEIHLNIL